MIGYIVLIIIILLPFQFALNVGENIDLVTTRILIPVVFLLWLARGLKRKKIRIPNKAETWLVLSFLFLSALSLTLGREADAGFRKILYFLTVFPVFFVTADILRKGEWRRKAFLAITVSGIMVAGVALFQFFLPLFVGIGKAVTAWENLSSFFLGNSFGKVVAANSSWLVNIGGETRMRAFGFFPDPHGFSFFANLCLFLGLGYFFFQKKTIPRVWVGLGLVLMTAAVGLSFSRGAYLGFLAGILFFTAVYLKRLGQLRNVAVVGGAILVLIFAFNAGAISQRLSSSFNLKEGSNAERYRNWTQAADMIRDWPLGGVGLGNYARTVDPRAPDRSSIYAHNLFLDIAAETGILNSLVFAALLLISLWRNARIKNVLNLGIAAGLSGLIVHSIFDTALYSPQALTLLLIIIAIGLGDNSKNKSEKRKTAT